MLRKIERREERRGGGGEKKRGGVGEEIREVEGTGKERRREERREDKRREAEKSAERGEARRGEEEVHTACGVILKLFPQPGECC